MSPPSKRRPAAPSCDGLRLARGSWFASAAVGACLRPIYAAVRGTRLSAANLRSERCYDVPEDGTAIGTTAWWLRVQARPATPGAGWFRVDLARNVTRRHAVTYRSIDAAAIEAGRARTPQLVHSTDVWEKLSVFVRSSCIKSSCPPGQRPCFMTIWRTEPRTHTPSSGTGHGQHGARPDNRRRAQPGGHIGAAGGPPTAVQLDQHVKSSRDQMQRLTGVTFAEGQ